MESDTDKDGFRIIPPANFETIEDIEYRLGNLDGMSKSEERVFWGVWLAIMVIAEIAWLVLSR
jgi:hypothetical protein